MKVVMIGATGATGGHALARVLADARVTRVTVIGRRAVATDDPRVVQRAVDMETVDWAPLVAGHDAAICTLGVGEPSKASRQEFLRIDHDIPLGFARAARAAGVGRFALLSAVGVSSASRVFYLRTKGQLEDLVRALGFGALVLAHPSVILTPQNRYGLSQAVVLRVWPWLHPMLGGSLRRYRGVRVDTLGAAIAAASLDDAPGVRVLEWDDFERIGQA